MKNIENIISKKLKENIIELESIKIINNEENINDYKEDNEIGIDNILIGNGFFLLQNNLFSEIDNKFNYTDDSKKYLVK